MHKYLQFLLLERRVRWPEAGAHELDVYKWIRSYYLTDSYYSPPGIFREEFTNPPQLVDPSCIKQPEDFVEAYRAYYNKFKMYYMVSPLSVGQSGNKPIVKMNSWTTRKVPEWLRR